MARVKSHYEKKRRHVESLAIYSCKPCEVEDYLKVGYLSKFLE